MAPKMCISRQQIGSATGLAGVNHFIHCITNVYLTAGVPPVTTGHGSKSLTKILYVLLITVDLTYSVGLFIIVTGTR